MRRTLPLPLRRICTPAPSLGHRDHVLDTVCLPCRTSHSHTPPLGLSLLFRQASKCPCPCLRSRRHRLPRMGSGTMQAPWRNFDPRQGEIARHCSLESCSFRDFSSERTAATLPVEISMLPKIPLISVPLSNFFPSLSIALMVNMSSKTMLDEADDIV